MTKEELLLILRDCGESGDVEGAHQRSDRALVEYVDDKDVADAYYGFFKWYSEPRITSRRDVRF